MKSVPLIFQLHVQQVTSVCLLELTWGSGQRERAEVPYPTHLMALYQTWKRAYLNFYEHYPPTAPLGETSDLRGRASGGGALTVHQDWQAQLVEAKATLLHEFHRWLRHPDFHPIWTILTQAIRDSKTPDPTLDLLITCTPIELTRLPWEAWDTRNQLGVGTIRIARIPSRIEQANITQTSKIRHRPRILAILGGGVEAQVDRQRMTSLNRQIADVTPLCQKPEQSIVDWKTEVVAAIRDRRGWEMLFFAGHSRETEITGGALEIAPGASIHMSELEQHLAIAQQNGLQFAIFNSCSGVSIAETLIKLGVGQVVVIRERIHNQVAQEFLVQFLEALSQFKDVHDCVIAACRYLKLEKDIAYPSAYLVPSLFRHPGAKLFQISSSARREILNRLYETSVAVSILYFSCLFPVQDYLLAQRLVQQAWYRNVTSQDVTNTSPILMVEINEDSLNKANIQQRYPIDRQYLAKLINQLTRLKAKVIALDYLLDRAQPTGDRALSQAIQQATAQNIRFLFAADCEGETFTTCNQWLRPVAQLKLSPDALGDIRLPSNGQSASYYLPFNHPQSSIQPFAYQLAQRYIQAFQPEVSLKSPFQPSIVTRLGYALGQMWLHPIVDFSLPPQQIYQRIPAWDLLLRDSNDLPRLQDEQVVMIVPGGYAEAGIEGEGEDNFPLPEAMRYWRLRQAEVDRRPQMAGSELHAYLYQHLLTQRAVMPIPDLWLALLALIAAKGSIILIQQRSPQRRTVLFLLIGGSILYVMISIQVYVSAAVLIPIVLPVSLYWLFILPRIISPKGVSL